MANEKDFGMRDYQSMGGMDAQSAGAPSYAAPSRGQEPAYGAELRFGTPSASVIARVPNLAGDVPAGVGIADEAVAPESRWRAWFSRKAIAGVAAVALMAAVSPWIVGLLRDKTETGPTADAKTKAPEVRVEFPAPNESEAPVWAGARSDASRHQAADSRDARRRSSLPEPDDADSDADRRDARRSDSRRTDLDRDQRTARRTSDAAADDVDDARYAARSNARTTARRSDADLEADRSDVARSRPSGIARRSESRPTTLSERRDMTPPESDLADTHTAGRGSSRYEAQGETPRGESIGASRRRSGYDASDTALDNSIDKRRSPTSASQDKYASTRDREEVASRRTGASRDRWSSEAVPTAYQDDARRFDAPRGGAADRSAPAGSERYDDAGEPSGRRASPRGGRAGDRDERPYGFSRRDGESGSSRTPAKSRETEPADADNDPAPRYPETRSAAPDRDDYGGSRASTSVSTNASRDVRSASYESTDQDLARFQGGIEEPTYRTSYERAGSSIR